MLEIMPKGSYRVTPAAASNRRSCTADARRAIVMARWRDGEDVFARAAAAVPARTRGGPGAATVSSAARARHIGRRRRKSGADAVDHGGRADRRLRADVHRRRLWYCRGRHTARRVSEGLVHESVSDRQANPTEGPGGPALCVCERL